ncbi:MAG: hypothetical protein ACREPM_03030 [Gemmatimonadaceae bacterium]
MTQAGRIFALWALLTGVAIVERAPTTASAQATAKEPAKKAAAKPAGIAGVVRLALFVDGAYIGMDQIDLLGLTPDGVAAIEVYERPSIVPVEFESSLSQKRSRGLSLASGCGAIAVWTKARVP